MTVTLRILTCVGPLGTSYIRPSVLSSMPYKRLIYRAWLNAANLIPCLRPIHAIEQTRQVGDRSAEHDNDSFAQRRVFATHSIAKEARRCEPAPKTKPSALASLPSCQTQYANNYFRDALMRLPKTRMPPHQHADAALCSAESRTWTASELAYPAPLLSNGEREHRAHRLTSGEPPTKRPANCAVRRTRSEPQRVLRVPTSCTSAGLAGESGAGIDTRVSLLAPPSPSVFAPAAAISGTLATEGAGFT